MKESIYRLVAVLAVVASACVPGGSVMPAVSPSGTLSPGEADRGRGAEGPFRVVFAGPEGNAPTGAEISIVFSRALRKLELAGNEATPPVKMTPALAGRWQWVGTHALLFVPEKGRLPGATQVRIEVPAETRALDGAQLGKAHAFTLTTPRPKLVRSYPGSGARGLEPKAKIELLYNQSIDPEVFERVSTLTATRGKKTWNVSFSAKRPNPAQGKRLLIVPDQPLPIHTQFAFHTTAELMGEEGPLKAGEPSVFTFETYGPLSVDRVNCNTDTPHGYCAPGGSIGIQFSNPVKFKDAKRMVSISAAGTTWDSWREDDDLTTFVDLSAKLLAGQKYTLTVGAGLTDKYGQRLGKAHSEAIRVDDLWPSVEIGVSGNTLEAKAARPITVGSVNVSSYQLVTAALRPEDLLKQRTGPAKQYDLVAALPGAKLRTIRAKNGVNVLGREPIDPSTVLPGAHRGALAIGVHYSATQSRRATEDRYLVKVIEVTDVAISAKLSRQGSLVWVTRLSDGAPLGNATVELYEKKKSKKSYTTDARGIATIPAKDLSLDFYRLAAEDAPVIVARNGDDWAYRYANDYVEAWRYEISTDLSGRQQRYGMMFTERGIYRPGDNVEVKGIVRAEVPTGNSVPSGVPFDLVLSSPTGDEVSRQHLKTNKFGTFSAKLRIPKAGSLGSWQLRAEKLEKDASISEYFEVAEYRAAEFKVTAESDKPEYVRGDKASWTGHGDYLFGAPMAKASARFNVQRSQTHFAPPGSEDFVTSTSGFYLDYEDEASRSPTLKSETAKLDAKGELKLSLDLGMPGQRGPELVSFDTEVTDVSRQSLAGSTSAIVHPASYYIGIGVLDDYFVDAPGKIAPKILAFSPKGQKVPGQKIAVELVRRKYTVARQDTGSERYHSVSKPVDTVLAKCEVTTAGAPVSCSLDVKEGGYYFLRARGTDARKNPVEASQSFFGIGAGAAWWRDGDKRILELALNKKEYKVGDVARVLVKSPFPEAEALVTVERAGVYRTERMKVKGPTPTVVVPISEDLRPNAFVSIHLVRGRSKAPPPQVGKPDVGAPEYRAGYAELKIDPEARRLAVEVTPAKKELKPGDTAEISLKVKDAAGKPKSAEVTLYAVDEGVLSLINYKTPDPLPVFTASRPLQVATVESRESLAKLGLDLGNLLGVDKGAEGGGGGEGTAARRDFRQSAYFNPSLQTDASGKATARFKLPESLTTFRVMAVATSLDDRYGYGESRVVTSRRLMARPALPRFLRAGDAMQAGVVVSGKAFGPAKVTVTASVSGIELSGDKEKSIDLPRDGSVEVRFPMLARSAGKAKFRFDVKAEGERDAVELERDISIPTVMESVALYGETEKAAGEALGDLSAIRKDVGKLEISVASTALVGLDAGAEQLIDYPYSCTEQLSSRLLPLVPLRELSKAFGLEMPKNTDAFVEKTIADIVSRQRSDGGFGMWPDSPESSPWVSTYALWVLQMAKKRGAVVPARVMDSSRAYVRRYLETIREDELYLATAAFIVDVLAEGGDPDTGYMSRLYQKRGQLPLFAKAFLLHAMAISKQKSDLVEKLTTEMNGNLRIEANSAFANENQGDDYAVLMDSPARSSAIVLRALLAAKPNHALGSKLARGILQARRGGTWRSTQETAFALLALDAYQKAQENTVPDYTAKVWFGGTHLFSSEAHGRSTSADTHSIATGKLSAKSGSLLVFEKDGAGKLFYEARLRYARKTLPTSPLDRGFFVQKTLRSVTPEGLPDAIRSIPELGSTKFAGGDLVIADLVIVTPSPREFVVIDDPLPAGLEAVDANLATTAAWLRVPESSDSFSDSQLCEDGCDPDDVEDSLAHGSAFLDSWYRREIRDDRVVFFVDHMAAGMYHYRYLARATTFGKFVVPPTKAEEMYTPEVFGRTGSVLVEVK